MSGVVWGLRSEKSIFRVEPQGGWGRLAAVEAQITTIRYYKFHLKMLIKGGAA
jgi:hypothetical protein